MKRRKIIIVIVLISIIAIMMPYKNFSSNKSWLVRYEYESNVIKDLKDQANREQDSKQVNVEPQENVFDIIIFMGQSNMVGQGDASKATTRINDRVGFEMEFNSSGEPYGLSKIAEPFGDTYGDADKQPTNWPKFTPSKGSMVTAFMNAYYLNTGVPVVGIPAGVSGSSIYKYWQDNQSGLETAKTKYEKTYQWMKDNGYKVRHSYMVWYQGESDVSQFIDADGNRIYENALKNTITEMQNIGIERCFLISIGGYYVLEDEIAEAKEENKEIYTNYEKMIEHQKEICEKNDWVTLVSTRAGILSKCRDMISDTEINGALYRCGNHLNQEALDIVGSEAGKNVAKYADQARTQTLTKTQSNALIEFGKKFAKDGIDAKKLVYGINNKAAAYNLQLVKYSEHTTASGTQLIWFGPTGKNYGWNGESDKNQFEPNYYIGLDCSGFVAFLYHRVFGLAFNYKYNNMINPWTTKEFIENRKIDTFEGETIEAFKVVYEQHAKEQKYTLNDLANLADLQPGDLLIGRGGKEENDNTNHIVIYSGKDSNGKDKMLHSTYSSEHYFSEQNESGKYYNMGESDLDKSEFKFRNVYVYRLNDNIIPKDYIYNDKPIDWSKLSINAPYDDMEPIIEKIEGKLAEWTNQDVTITVTAKDDGKIKTEDEGKSWIGIGLADEPYSFDNGQSWQTTNSKTYTENTSGIKIKVKDNAGNITSYEQTIDINNIDKTDPTITITPNGSHTTQSKGVTITVADVGGSGLSNNNSYQYQLGTSGTEVPTGTWKNYSSGREFLIGEGLTGDYYLWVKTIEDNAGNESSKTDYMVSNKYTFNSTIKDTTNPTISSVSGNATEWTNKNVTLTISATDNESGIAGYSFDNGQSWQTTNSKTYTENTSGIKIKVKDNAGNITSYEQTIDINKIDKTAPTITIIPNGSNTTQSKGVTITVADVGGSGLSNNNNYQYQLGTSGTEVPTGTWKNYSSGREFLIGEGLTGDYYLWVKTIEDNAGNESSETDYIVSNKFIFDNGEDTDTIAPELSVEYSTTQITNKSVTATIKSNEEVQEVNGWTISKDAKTLTKTYTTNTTEYIDVYDLAGNKSTVKVKITNIDKTEIEAIVEYSTTILTNKNVTVKIISNKEIKEIDGWTLLEDNKTLTKEYIENSSENIKLQDLFGNEREIKISVQNIDKIAPKVDVKYSTLTQTNKSLTVKITANEELQSLEGWTLSKDRKTLIKIYTKNTTENLEVYDLAGNKVRAKISISNIDTTLPNIEVKYSTTENTKEDVLVTIVSDEQLQEVDGWKISEDRKTLTKKHEKNVEETIKIYDIAGNEFEVQISVKNIDKTTTQKSEVEHTQNSEKPDTAPMEIPKTGSNSLVGVIIITIIVSIVSWIQSRKYKDIK